jgi:hypothetical protein
MLTQAELEALLESLSRNQLVNLGRGSSARARAWFRCQVESHDVASGRIVLTCFVDRPTDRPIEPGERVVLAAVRSDNDQYLAPMRVEDSSGGTTPRLSLLMAGKWQPEHERREQTRIDFNAPVQRARRWTRGAWHDIAATFTDISSRGIGLITDQQLQLGERLSLTFPLGPDDPPMRVTIEVRHIRPDDTGPNRWRAGGQFRMLPPEDHERIVRFIFAEMRRGLS